MKPALSFWAPLQKYVAATITRQAFGEANDKPNSRKKYS